MSATHKTLATPNPAYRSLMVSISESSFASNGGQLPPQGTRYDDNAWRSLIGADYRKEFADFVYIQQSEDSKDGGTVIFSRQRTPTQRNTPFRTTTEFGNHRWPPILKELRFIPARDFPLATQNVSGNDVGTVYAVRYLVREVYIPEVNEGTRFVTEEFTSDVPFDIPQYSVPTPTSVSYHYLNLRGGFPECLHKKIDLKALISTISSNYSGTTASNYNELEGQIFPATNFIEWAPYVLSDKQELTGGVWYRKRVRVYPPPMPEVIINTQ